MTTVGFFICIGFLLIIGIVTLINVLFNKNKTYPPYYRDVEITYQLPGEGFINKRAWLACNDDLEYIWTLSDSDIIIPDKYVLNWKEI